MFFLKKTKIAVISFVAVMVLVAIGIFIFWKFYYKTDLRTQLAITLGVNPSVLWINLPPAKNRLPGAAFIYQSTLLAIDSVQSQDEDIISGDEFNIGWVNSTGSKLNASADAGFLGLIYGGSGNLKVDFQATKCQSLEVPVNKLKQRLLSSEEVKEQAAEGKDPLVVVRSYKGLIKLRISKTDSTSAESWQNIKEKAKSLNSNITVKGERDDSLEIAFNQPVVFAYEMVSAKLITTHLGVEPDDVEFTPVSEPLLTLPLEKKAEIMSKEDPRKWVFASAVVSDFPKLKYLQDQNWDIKYSVDRISKSFARFNPTLSIDYRSDPKNLSTAERLNRFAEDVGYKAKQINAKLVVFYYIGHATTSSTGEVLMLQSGVNPKEFRKLTKPYNAQVANIANLEDIMRVVNAANPIPSGVAVRLSELHATLSKSGIPFVILLDGCMENEKIKQFLEDAGFQYNKDHPTLYYVGQEPLTQRIISGIGSSLQDFGKAWSYLSDTNPIIFAAKPGTLANPVKDPIWELSPPSAPLAQRAHRLLAPSVTAVPKSLAELLTRMVDFRQGVGSIDLDGTISWSDFSVIEKIAHTIVASDIRIPFVDANVSVVAQHNPDIGVIESFYFNETKKQFYFVSQGNDWKIWQWDSIKKNKNILANNLLFPLIAGTIDGRVFLHYDENKTLSAIDNGRFQPIKKDVYAKFLAIGYKPSELLVIMEAPYIKANMPVWIASKNQFNKIDDLPFSDVISVIQNETNRFIYTRSENQSAIYLHTNGHDSILANNLEAPGQLTRYADITYCLSKTKTRLYRLVKDSLQQADLLTSTGDALLQASYKNYPDGFQAVSKGNLLITSGSSIIELKPDKLLWVSVQKTLSSLVKPTKSV